MKQVRLNASSIARDPGLNAGRAYFRDPFKHKKHVEQFDKRFPNERSACNDHKAVSEASTSKLANLTATGIVSVFCGRHDTFQPDGTTDLRVGERYVFTYEDFRLTQVTLRQVDVDFAYLGQLKHKSPDHIVSGYDVNCQYSVKLFSSRIPAYPPELRPRQPCSAFQFLVPKFHLNAHILHCRTNFSYNWAPGVGRTDGEGPERGWSANNALAGSAKQMTPGGRWDVIDDHFGDWNWRKSITLCVY